MVELGKGYSSRFTESVGYIVFGVYNWAAVIVLLNMLIAMMTRSFEKITVSVQNMCVMSKYRRWTFSLLCLCETYKFFKNTCVVVHLSCI